jgi:hypothetical protein
MFLLVSLVSAAPTYTQAWSLPAKDVKNTVIAPWGDLIYTSGNTVVLAARNTGQMLLNTTACSKPVGLGFAGDKRLIVTCSTEAYEVVYPAGSARKIIDYDDDVTAGLVQNNRIAVGTRSGKVMVYEATTGKLLNSYNIGNEVGSIAISPDGKRLAAVGEEGGFLFTEGQPVQYLGFDDLVVFSPDGGYIFAKSGSFAALRWKLETTEVVFYKTGSWLNGAVFLGGSAVIAGGGSDGLVIYEGVTKAPVQVLDKDSRWEHLSATQDGSFFCGANWSVVACYSSAPVAASQFTSIGGVIPDPNAETPAPTSTPNAGAEIFGTSASRNGTTATIKIEGTQTFTVGSKFEASVYFENKIGNVSLSGWLVIGTVQVKPYANGVLTVTILTEESTVTVNDQPVNHWAAGKRIKLKPL